jgi:hypothetical protein
MYAMQKGRKKGQNSSSSQTPVDVRFFKHSSWEINPPITLTSTAGWLVQKYEY